MKNDKHYNLGMTMCKLEETEQNLEVLKERIYEQDKIGFEDALDRFLRHCPSSAALDERGTDELFSITDSTSIKDFAETCLWSASMLVERVYKECMIPDQCKGAIRCLFRFAGLAILENKANEIDSKLSALRTAQSSCSTDEADEESGKLVKQIKALEHEANRIETARDALRGASNGFVDILCTNVIEEEEEAD